jgi:hypothetical protein
MLKVSGLSIRAPVAEPVRDHDCPVSRRIVASLSQLRRHAGPDDMPPTARILLGLALLPNGLGSHPVIPSGRVSYPA